MEHPDWSKSEDRYVTGHALGDLAYHPPLPQFRGRSFGEIEELRASRAALEDPQQCDATLLELVRRLGPEVLRAPPRPGCRVCVPTPDTFLALALSDPPCPRCGQPTPDTALSEEVTLRLEVLTLCWNRLVAAYWCARDDCDAGQDAAATFLKRLGNALAGDRRGRRAQVTNLFALRALYHRKVFRLLRARRLLKARGSTGSSLAARIRATAKDCGLPEADLRNHLLDNHGNPQRPISVREEARIWTARHFGVTQQTVSNLLVHRSRK